MYPMCTKLLSILTFLVLALSFACESDYSYQIQIGFQYESDRVEVARVTIWILEGDPSCFELTSGEKIPQQLTAHARFEPVYPFDAINKIKSITKKKVLIFAEANDENGAAFLRACNATQAKGSSLRVLLELRRICADDSDSDGICDSQDMCTGNDVSGNTDGDDECNDVDADDDNDGWSDGAETACGSDPLLVGSVPIDADADHICDSLDQCTGDDASGNIDGDAQCNDMDSDDDDDGWSDSDETACGTNSLLASSVPADSDNDGICNLLDQCTGDDASGNTDGDTECDDSDTDDDNDGWSDVDELNCGTDPLQDSSTPIDEDSNGVCDAIEASAKLGGPYYVAVGESLLLDGSGSLPSDGETIFSWEWDLDNNGDFSDVTSPTPAAISDTDLQNTWGMTAGSNTIHLRVTDSADRTSTISGTVTLILDPTMIVSDFWNEPSAWYNSTIPSGQNGAVIDSGIAARVNSDTTPTYSGGLLLRENASLMIGWNGFKAGNANALGTAPITMRDGSEIIWRNGSQEYGFVQGIVLDGDATIWAGASSIGHHSTKTFSGGVSGPGMLTYNGVNNTWFRFDNANPAWTGGLQSNDPQGQGHQIAADHDGCFGTGNVFVNNNCSLQISAGLTDTIDDTASLALNGVSSTRVPSKLILDSNETVNVLLIEGVQMPAGTYTNGETWLSGDGVLTVLIDP